MARHLLKKCLCQLRYVQEIPQRIPTIPSKSIDRWFVGNVINSAPVIVDHAKEVQFSMQCVDGYLEWYFIVSHPHIIPLVEYEDGVELYGARRPSDDVSAPPPFPSGVTDQHHLQMIAVIIDNFMGLVNSDDEVYTLGVRTSDIARGRSI